jgi:hypothetical protein
LVWELIVAFVVVRFREMRKAKLGHSHWKEKVCSAQEKTTPGKGRRAAADTKAIYSWIPYHRALPLDLVLHALESQLCRPICPPPPKRRWLQVISNRRAKIQNGTATVDWPMGPYAFDLGNRDTLSPRSVAIVEI